MTVANSTVASNAGEGGASFHNSGNGGDARFLIRSSLMAGPRLSENCGGSGNGRFSSQGFNIADDDSCPLTASTDRPQTDPMLGPLAANGGPTLTHALLRGSPAIDRGTSDTALTGVGVLTTDQRGLPRPSDFAQVDNTRDGTDVGAFELRPPPGPGPGPVDQSVRIAISGSGYA